MNGVGALETYAKRRLEILDSFKSKRQTENDFSRFDMNKPRNFLKKTKPREPVSHNKGHFKMALKVSELPKIHFFTKKKAQMNYLL